MMNEREHLAKGVVYTPQASINAFSAKPGFSDGFYRRLHDVRDMMEETRSLLSGINERLQGAAPVANAAAGTAASPQGALDEMLNAMTSLSMLADSVRDEARRLAQAF